MRYASEPIMRCVQKQGFACDMRALPRTSLGLCTEHVKQHKPKHRERETMAQKCIHVPRALLF